MIRAFWVAWRNAQGVRSSDQPGQGRPGSGVGAVWSHRCGWDELLVPVSLGAGAVGLDLAEGWPGRWSAELRLDGREASCPVEHLAFAPFDSVAAVRGFSWRRGQRHRPGLQYAVSTGRLHGFESLQEAMFLLALDFAGQAVEVLSQPMRLTFWNRSGTREHTPDFLALTRSGMWLIDVRPADRIKDEDRESFAAAAVAEYCGWRFALVGGWLEHVPTTLDWFSSQRRPLVDQLAVQPGLLAGARERATFGQLAQASAYPPVARAHLLHLLWHRRIGLDLRRPLGDQSIIVAAEE
jgi:hypothetical protein